MKLRRVGAICAMTILAVSAASVTAFAHGHGGYRKIVNTTAAVNAQYVYCPVQDCILAGAHEHGGVIYNGHHAQDGHTYHTQSYRCGNRANAHHH